MKQMRMKKDEMTRLFSRALAIFQVVQKLPQVETGFLKDLSFSTGNCQVFSVCDVDSCH